MASIYDSSPDKVLKAIELVDRNLWEQSVNHKWRLDNSGLANIQTPTASMLQNLKQYASDYHSAKLMAQFSDASELHEPYIQLLEDWIECTASYYNLTQEVLKAKVNIMLGRIVQQDKKIQRIRFGLGAVCVACTAWIGMGVQQSVGIGREREIVEQQLGQVNVKYNQIHTEALKSFPAKKSKGLLGFAKYVIGYEDPPPDDLSKVEMPQNPVGTQKDLLDKLKVVGQQRKQILDESNRLGTKQSGIIISIVFASLVLIFIPLYGWVWIPANRYKGRKIY